MVAAEILNELSRAELTITVIDGGFIKVEPKDKITTTLRDKIRENKVSILAMLSPRRDQAVHNPAPCQGCHRFEVVEIQGEAIPGCLYEITDGEWMEGWKRLPRDTKKCIIH